MKTEIKTEGIRFSEMIFEKEIARVFLYFMRNDIKGKWFAYVEDLYVDSAFRGMGIATRLIKKCIQEAKKRSCYKVVLTTQYEYLHKMYEDIGFNKTGVEFKIYL